MEWALGLESIMMVMVTIGMAMWRFVDSLRIPSQAGMDNSVQDLYVTETDLYLVGTTEGSHVAFDDVFGFNISKCRWSITTMANKIDASSQRSC